MLRHFFLLCVELSSLFDEIKKPLSDNALATDDSERLKMSEDASNRLVTIKQEFEDNIKQVVKIIYKTAQRKINPASMLLTSYQSMG